jgi:hypothetical protein
LSRAKFITKVPGHDIVIAQVMVHHHAFHVAQGGGNAPRGITQVAAWNSAAGAKLAHHPAKRSAQSLGLKVFPSWVMPWIKTSLAELETIG